MAIIKCKMCGGDMVISDNKTYGTCEYCGSQMTLPKIDDDQRAAAFNRGNHFRRIGEFDKALQVYERIVREDENDAEAHWCCALSRFGIEYVKDPATYEYLPTCHRASFDNFLEDIDYLAAVEHSDGVTRIQYQKDGAKIAEVQRGILAASQNEKPYDVFLCYKETDEKGERTVDSVLAQEIYYQLTDQGRRVFFSRITLEDKAGTEYEPYIFAALNSAKVMVVVGTCAENLNAVWVKNEWSRFLAMMKHDRSKLLLPCYRDMDPYDMPQELSILQSYDMSRIGFIQDLIRGIGKVLSPTEKQPKAAAAQSQTQSNGSNLKTLLERGYISLESREWKAAYDFFEGALNQDARCSRAYLGKVMAEYHISRKSNICKSGAEVFENANYKNAIRFSDETLRQELQQYKKDFESKLELKRKKTYYEQGCSMLRLQTRQGYEAAIQIFEELGNFEDAPQLLQNCREILENLHTYGWDTSYAEAEKLMEEARTSDAPIPIYEKAKKILEEIVPWRDSEEKAQWISQTLSALQGEKENKIKEHNEKVNKRKKLKKSVIFLQCFCIIFAALLFDGFNNPNYSPAAFFAGVLFALTWSAAGLLGSNLGLNQKDIYASKTTARQNASLILLGSGAVLWEMMFLGSIADASMTAGDKRFFFFVALVYLIPLVVVLKIIPKYKTNKKVTRK